MGGKKKQQGSVVVAGGNIVRQKKSTPVQIIAYEATLEKIPERYGGARVRHVVTYRSRSRREIAALEVGLACFDHFDELIVSGGGLVVEPLPPSGAKDPLGHPIAPRRGEWLEYAAELSAFATAFAWVDQVRFADGEVWRQGRREIAKKLRELRGTLDSGPLAGEPGGRD